MAFVLPAEHAPLPLDELAELYRTIVDSKLDPHTRSALGQYMTPAPIARFMASLFTGSSVKKIRLLDPGAGIGSLTAAYLTNILEKKNRPAAISAACYEIEPLLVEYLRFTLERCRKCCEQQHIRFTGEIVEDDFIRHGAQISMQADSLFGKPHAEGYSHCIMNPPYKKIQSDSEHRQWLRGIDVEASNLYAGFLAVAIKLLAPGGQLVAIVPRSFCNGPYFRPFRTLLLDSMALVRLHVFDSRDQAFKDNEVLQENLIFHAIKGASQGRVLITTSPDGEFGAMTEREVSFEHVVRSDDPFQFIHVAAHDIDQRIVDRMRLFTHSLSDLGLSVSTGPVVDFRLQNDLCQNSGADTVPLIYSSHFADSGIEWPNKQSKKPNAIIESDESRKWLMPNGWYALTRRFSAKEEKRRIVAAIYNPDRTCSKKVGFENHLNVFHKDGVGLGPAIAKGLTVYLNSTLVDLYFRQFNGHTQVNAADLRNLPYPDLKTLNALGNQIGQVFPSQKEIDHWLNGVISKMSKKKTPDPAQSTHRIAEALSVLKQLGFPRAQQNDRSALTLLALLALKPDAKWSAASNPMTGITPIMDFCRLQYGRNYAPNTRETFRRQTMHQFVQASLVIENPDEPSRAVNSPNWVYQIEPKALKLLQKFGNKTWESKLSARLAKKDTLAKLYAKERKMHIVPVSFQDRKLTLTAGRHNELIKLIMETFAPRFVPGGRVLYIGDTGAKMAHFDNKGFEKLGLRFDSHGKFPDVVLYSP
ncbi:MAG: BsuBI/PstI family type II restriction endonuclease, partial [Ktedonobacteraceae bacterium]